MAVEYYPAGRQEISIGVEGTAYTPAQPDMILAADGNSLAFPTRAVSKRIQTREGNRTIHARATSAVSGGITVSVTPDKCSVLWYGLTGADSITGGASPYTHNCQPAVDGFRPTFSAQRVRSTENFDVFSGLTINSLNLSHDAEDFLVASVDFIGKQMQAYAVDKNDAGAAASTIAPFSRPQVAMTRGGSSQSVSNLTMTFTNDLATSTPDGGYVPLNGAAARFSQVSGSFWVACTNTDPIAVLRQAMGDSGSSFPISYSGTVITTALVVTWTHPSIVTGATVYKLEVTIPKVTLVVEPAENGGMEGYNCSFTSEWDTSAAYEYDIELVNGEADLKTAAEAIA